LFSDQQTRRSPVGQQRPRRHGAHRRPAALPGRRTRPLSRMSALVRPSSAHGRREL